MNIPTDIKFRVLSKPRMRKHTKAKAIDWHQKHIKQDIEVSKSAVQRLITKHERGPGTNGHK